MEDVYLLLGSNVGNRLRNIENATVKMRLKAGPLIVSSSLYETEPWGLKEQESFINQVVLIRTNLEANELLMQLKTIEREMGRIDEIKWGPRIIDMDILFYGKHVIDTPQLKVPHPFIPERKFTLVPLFEIAPRLVHPLSKQTIGELLESCMDNSDVHRVSNKGLM